LTVRSFHDLPLWVKVLIAPAACLGTGAIVAASIWLGAMQTEAGLADVMDVAMPSASASAKLHEQVDTIQTKAMRALVWQQAGVQGAAIDALVVEIGQELKAFSGNAAAMAAGRAEGDADLTRLRSIISRSAEYSKQLDDALDLVSDPAIAVGMFRRTDASFEALRKEILGLFAENRAAEAASIQAARRSSHASLIRTNWIVGGSGLLMLVLLPIVVTAIVRPVRALTRTMKELAAGNTEAEAVAQDHRDELGDMARTVAVFREHMISESCLAAAQDEERQRADAGKRAALVGMATTIEEATRSALRQIGDRTSAMTDVADAMSTSATRTGGSAHEAATAAAQAQTIVKEVAGATEQLATSIRAIGGQVAQSTAVVERAVAAGEQTRATIESLNQEVERIGAVTDMIGEIAGKTNLLPLFSKYCVTYQHITSKSDI